MGSAVKRLQEKVYGTSSAGKGGGDGSAIKRLQEKVYGGAAFTVNEENSYAAKLERQKRQEAEKTAADRGFFSRAGDTLKGIGHRQAEGYAGALEAGTELLGAAGSALQDRKERQQAEQDRKLLERYRKDLASAKAAGDARAIKAAQLRIKGAEKRLEMNGSLGDYYDRVNAEAARKVSDFGDRHGAQAERAFQRAKAGTGKAGSLVVDVAAGLGDVLGDAAANAALPGLGTAARVARSFGHGAETAEEKGVSIGRQALYGAGSAALGEGVNRLFSGNPILEKATGKGALDDLLFPSLGKTLPGRMVKSGIGEGIEEGTESLLDPLVQILTMGQKNTDPLDLKSAGYDALVGAMIGGLTGISAPKQGHDAPAQAAGTPTADTVDMDAPAAQDGAQGITDAKKAAPTSGAAVNKGETVQVVENLRSHIPSLQGMDPVSTVSVNSIPFVEGKTMAEKARRLFEAIKGVVTRPGFGDVDINGRSVKDDLSHGVGAAKAAVIPAIPEIIRQGKQIDFQQNWKGRAYDGYVFAAPVTMDGHLAYVAAVVKRTSKNRFYLHEVIDADGNVIKIDAGESANQTSLAADGDAGTHSPASVDLSPITDADTGRDPAASVMETAPVEGTRPLNSDFTIPQGAESVNSVDPLLKLMLGGQRVDQSKASNEQFAALAERGDVGVDAAGKLYQVDPAEHIDRRTMDSVSGRKLNAFQFDHPELHGYYQKAARALIADADLSLQFPMTRSYARGMQGNEVHQKVEASAHLRKAMDETGLTRAQIIDAAQRILNDKGQENVKAAKQVELILDAMLSDGWITMAGDVVFADRGYLAAKEEILGSRPLEEDGYLPDELDALPGEADGGMMGETVLTEIVMEEPEANAERNEPDHDTQKRSVAVRGVQEAHPVHGDVRGVPGRYSEGDQVRKSDLQGARKSRPEVSTSGEIDQRGSGGPEDAGRGMPRGAETGNPFEERSQAMQQVQKAGELYGDLPTASQEDSVRGSDGRGLPGVRGGEVTDGLGAADAGFDPYSRLQNQTDQFHPEGAYAARPVEVPVEDFDGRNIPKSASTVMGAQGTTDSGVRELERQIAAGELSFDTIHDADAVRQAQRTVAEKGFDGAMEQYRQAVAASVATKDNTALGQQLLLQAMREGDERATAELLALYTRNSTTAAQAMQAQSIFRKLSPEGQLVAVQKAVSALNEKHGTKVELDPEDVADFLSAQTEKERRKVTERMVEKAAKSVPGTFRAKLDTLRYLAMLGNFRTHIRNILGNTLFQVPVAVKNRAGAVAEAIAYRASGGKTERTKALFGASPFGKLAAEARADWANVKDFLGQSGKYRDEQTSLWDIEQKADAFSDKHLMGRAINKAADFNNRALEAEDTAAKKWIYTQSLAGYLKANGCRSMADADTALLNRARDYAAQEALRNTFNDHNAVSDFVSKLGGIPRSENPFARKFGYITEGVLPFKRTPANIAVRAVEYSPVGMVLGAVETVRGAHKGDMAKVATGLDRVAAGVSGTALLAAGFLAAGAGYVTGGEDDDEKQAAFDDLTGHQNYALELKNGLSITLDWLAPEAIPFFMGVELYEQGLSSGLSFDDVYKAIKNASAPMLEMSMLQGLNDAFENASYAKDRGDSVFGALVVSALTNYFTQLFPTIGGQLERSGEEVRMTTYIDKNKKLPTDLQYTLGKVSQKIPIPGVDYQQIPYLDAWGREEETGDALERSVNSLFNPAYVSQVDVDKVERELQRVKDATGDGGVFPRRAGRSIEFDGKTHDLNAEQYQKYARAKGRGSYSMVSAAINSPAYRSMDSGEKAEFVKKMYGYADYKAKRSVFPAYENNVYKKYAEAEAAGMSPSGFYVMKQTYDYDHSSQTGQPTQAEAQRYLDTETALDRSQKADLWTIINSSWKNNPYT